MGEIVLGEECRFRAGQRTAETVEARWFDSFYEAWGYAAGQMAEERARLDKAGQWASAEELHEEIRRFAYWTPAMPLDRVTAGVAGFEWFVATVPQIEPDGRAWVAGSGNRTADEANFVAHGIAERYGMDVTLDERAALDAVVWSSGYHAEGWAEGDTDGDWLNELGNKACEHLCELAPAGWLFVWDDGLSLQALCEVEGFEPEQEECPHGEKCPNRR